ncbi:DUF4198 domain-containing protein [Flexithrix dorotheae]|uniref:DUF4198 domain-containing protein n=1 Tax=Flexithrix dorotheae TaxID=70993 RepID=UPI00039EDC3B|nr:DUF4198 domain-containing protein [Flexithrix dorotheae]
MKLNTSVISKEFKNKFCKPFFMLLAFMFLCSHDLYLKMETYFLQPNQEVTLSLYNGTFENSENIITRDRMLDASILAHGKREAINPNQWQDQDSTITQLTFNAGEAGTYVAGVSTKARNIALAAEEFNSYLEHDGVLDMLEYRTNHNLLDQDAVESYQKHVKVIYQVGDTKTNDWNTVFSYPIEFVPQTNPYEKYSGEKLEVQLLSDGKPLPNQLVFADYIKSAHAHTHNDHSHKHEHGGEAHSHEHPHDDEEHDHTHEPQEAHTHTSGQQLRTNAQGMVMVDLPEDGIYYLRTIHMINVTDSDELTHQSKWATLTFEITHKHDSSTHTHEEHHHEDGIPTWGFILGSLLIIGVLFLVFRKKN